MYTLQILYGVFSCKTRPVAPSVYRTLPHASASSIEETCLQQSEGRTAHYTGTKAPHVVRS